MNVERALDLLAQCAYRFRDDHGTDEIGALLAEARTCYDAAEQADPATVAIGRSLIAAFELRLCTDVENQVNSGWDYDLEGPPLNGVEEDDWDDVSRPVAERAAEAARAALDADPEDPLVPIHLGHALAWLGDRDGAVAAYREALRRDPYDDQADTCLEMLEAETGPSPALKTSPRSYAFALLREKLRISNSEWIDIGHVCRTLASARDAAEAKLRETGDLTREELDGFIKLELDVHRPGQPVATFELMDRIPSEPNEGPFRFDWSDVPLDEPLEPPLPPGKPLRIENLMCF
ncbi:tetratricopeptide repeat protein [Streptomyces sp. NPDC056921]|uniref:tetratricopeptide repeat protein n=1 Tax=Streptomyces sp. NPDC056921 TaxID=3345966 RepID=UPI00363CE624